MPCSYHSLRLPASRPLLASPLEAQVTKTHGKDASTCYRGVREPGVPGTTAARLPAPLNHKISPPRTCQRTSSPELQSSIKEFLFLSILSSFLDYQQDFSPVQARLTNSTTSAMANSSGVQQTPVGTLSPPDSSSSASQSPISPTHGVRIPLAVADVPDAGLANRSPEDPVKASELKDDSDGRSRESAVPAACLACVSETVLLLVLLVYFLFSFSSSSPTSLRGVRLIPQRHMQKPQFSRCIDSERVI